MCLSGNVGSGDGDEGAGEEDRGSTKIENSVPRVQKLQKQVVNDLFVRLRVASCIKCVTFNV